MATAAGSTTATRKPTAAGTSALPLKLILAALCMAQFINAYDCDSLRCRLTA